MNFKTVYTEKLKIKIFLYFEVYLIFAYFFILILSVPAYASDFTSSYLRLSDTSASSALSGTVCGQPSSGGAGVENRVLITFPGDFTLSTNASDWTTGITNLPQGSVSWPGIGATATNVSGQTITFSSSDLTSTSLYCFNFSAASSTTSPSAGSNKTGTITTEDSSNSIINSNNYAVSIVPNNQVTITAKVDPAVSTLPITLSSITSGTQFPQNTVISYQINYGSTNPGPIPLTIQAQWSQGTISGSPTPSVDILSYVVGSATNAYASTAPVIDTVNRTITWTISSFPANTTGQTVNFSLETTANYTGSNTVSYTVSARATSGQTVTPDTTVTQNYLYNSPSVTSTPTPAPVSAASTPTPTPASSQQLLITGVSIQSISQNQARILITTNNSATLTLFYGVSSSNLDQKIISLTPNNLITITVTNLTPDTNYYFKVTATDTSGNTLTSDIFTFRTAVVSNVPSVNLQTLVAVSNNVVLLAYSAQNLNNPNPKNIIIIPVSTVYQIHFFLKQNAIIKTIQAIVVNKNVLADNTYSQNEANSNYVNLIQTEPGVYEGKLLSQKDPGNYELYTKIVDYNGNIALQKIADIKVVSKFMVLEKDTKKPIENARVLLYLYNPTIKIYEVVSPQALAILNPSFSLPNGEVDFVLPQGKYKANISALGYSSDSTAFEINPYTQGYPTVYLTAQPFNLVNLITYYANTFRDGLDASSNYLYQHASSSRLFDLITMSSLFIFVLSAFVSFSARTHVPVLYIPDFFFHKIKLIFGKNHAFFIYGRVIDKETNYPLTKTSVSIEDTSQNKIVANLKTNKLGEFYFDKAFTGPYKISVMKEGFVQNQTFDYKNSPVSLAVNTKAPVQRPLLDLTVVFFEDFLGILLEYIIISSVVVEFFFIYTFGFIRILPFIIISTSNIILLLLFFYKPGHLQY